ncbi:MAG: alkaline phosphatase D family protein [Phenylobacterium sp.]|uniref:alkaline phosphatase D family protein n=1 Tax=Phenylobacterium sp. TaxID=1871053 RepID=UPI001A4F0781|nr:alkaline phosphatase D family protein [Phenylobacterium sp.]MBL8773322.1 alkaline phosphatase D family protein [Phenylobacterium sp.]
MVRWNSGSAATVSPLTDRRRLLVGLAAPGAVVPRRARASIDPFTLGVASGAPSPDGFVLWTRLAPDPLAPDGRGGLSSPVRTRFEVAADDGFRRIVRQGEVWATPQDGHAIHLEVGGLPPDRPYWYRFEALGHASPVGRARTAPDVAADNTRLRFVVASCAHWESGWFSAYRHMAAEAADLVLFLGDYIYEYSHRPERQGLVRRHDRQGDAVTLADYRNRYALYRTDPDLQALHAAAPCLVTWDDHEVQNDYANRWSQDASTPTAEFLRRRAAAYRAFYEHMPLRPWARPRGPDMRLHGRTRFGRLAEFTVLDGRQHRSPQPCQTAASRRGRVTLCDEMEDPRRSMLGPRQERWLEERFRRADARWNVVAQDLVVARLEQTAADGRVGHYTDGWDGYQANRTRMLGALADARTPNPVFLAGDIHSFWANDLKSDFRDPRSPTVAAEFVTTSITADNPGRGLADAEARNPHVRFLDLRSHGYLVGDLGPQRLDVAYRKVSDRRDPNATVSTLRRFAVETGRPGVMPA